SLSVWSMTMSTRSSHLEVFHKTRGVATYRLEIWHDGLKKHRVVKGSAPEIVQRVAALQMAEWEERWSHLRTREQDRYAKENRREHQEAKKRHATERTVVAQQELENLSNLLRQALAVNNVIDWEKLKDTSPFPEPMPTKPPPPVKPQPQSFPPEPHRSA